jgi:hypothetical protein
MGQPEQDHGEHGPGGAQTEKRQHDPLAAAVHQAGFGGCGQRSGGEGAGRCPGRGERTGRLVDEQEQ